jgi:serine/threonine protein kinase
MSDPAATGDWPTLAGTTPVQGPTIPGYEILGEVGRGGMGVVYKARQVSLNRLVALKVLREGALAAFENRARFRIEAEAAARMRHANFVQIYEVNDHQGSPYLAMELVEGGSLETFLAGQLQAPGQAAELVRTLAVAIHHAHGQQVIHRDLKPANVLLQIADNAVRSDRLSSQSTIRDLQSAIPKISDFGLAKRLDQESTGWTREGAVLGTASYMAPEQAAGRTRDIGPAVDVYALGAILYELLTGRPPFQADSWNHTVEQVIHVEPDPPTRFHAALPRDLETICLKCLEKEPGRRYATAGDLADDLGRFLEAKPVVAVPLGEQERLVRLARRDGYDIVAEIGHGPRSAVYHALHGPLKQPVALKVFQRGACTRQEWEGRLQRGANLWATLAHPHIVPVHQAGWWDGIPYVAVDFVPQGSLADKRTGQPTSVRQALHLLERLAEIVSYLHRQGVVHGNMKPSNVLLAADGIPRVVDFHPTGGLFLGPLQGMDATSAGLCYVAPELVRNPRAEPRLYTDIHGLGVILYELLTGRPPFAGNTASETLELVCSQEPAAPSLLNPEVPPDLEASCLRCLRKNPWQRYHRAYDLQMRMRSFLDGPGDPSAPSRRSHRRETGPRTT